MDRLPGSLEISGRLLSGVVLADEPPPLPPLLAPELEEPHPPRRAAPPNIAPAARKSRRFTCCMRPLLFGLTHRRQAYGLRLLPVRGRRRDAGVRQYSQRIRRQVQADRVSRLVPVAPGALHQRLELLAAGQAHEDLVEAPAVDDALHQPRDAVLPRRVVGLQTHALGPDDELGGPLRVGVAGG